MLVDRLEELLVQAAEDDEEQEDALALGAKWAASAAPAPEAEEPPKGQPETGNREGQERAEREAAPAEYSTAPVSMEQELPRAAGTQDGGEYPMEDGGPLVLGKESETLRALRAGGGQAVELESGKRAAAETDREAVSAAGAAAERGLEALYRRTAQASRPAPQVLPVEQAGRTMRAEEPGRAAALTVDELDWAVRRDSRRYDGGMTIF